MRQAFHVRLHLRAARIGSDDAFALVMPEANTGTMQEYLDQFSWTLPKDEVAVMYADQPA